MANKALLVGINKYKIPGADLSGCVNDVTNSLFKAWLVSQLLMFLQVAGIIRHLRMLILEAVTMVLLLITSVSTYETHMAISRGLS